jgi:SSS family solute:Na+ symporter
LNQFIVQRTLAAGSLAQGQKGILFAAAIKLFLPFLVVMPGIMAVQILGDDYDPQNADAAYPTLIRELLPAGVLGLMLAAVAGAVLSTFNSGLNSAATVFTLDLWGTHVDPEMSDRRAVRVGRITTTVLAIAACLWAPVIHGFDGVFSYIQEIWGFVSAPTCAIFFMGLLVARVPAGAAKTALVVGPILYLISRSPTWIMTGDDALAAGGGIQFLFDYASMSFLYHMFIIFILLCAMLWFWSVFAPGPVRPLPRREVVEMAPMKGLTWVSVVLLLSVTGLYIVFW